MASIPVLQSKLTMPQLPGNCIVSSRIKDLHQALNEHPVTVIRGPAGYGKTSLAVSYLKRPSSLPPKVCWYRIDTEDANPSAFMSYLTASIFPDDREGQSESRMVLEDSGLAGLEPSRAAAMICQDMWAIHNDSGDTKTYIVLDDFHNVAQVTEICDVVRFMLDNLPPSFGLLVLSRSDRQVFTEKQKLERHVLEIGPSDLVFTRDEIREYGLIAGLKKTDERLMDFIAKTTEGWAAGIAIIYQAVRSTGRRSASISPSVLGHEDAVFRYMSSEVIKSVDKVTREALVKLAVLEDFSDAEAMEILGIEEVQSLIDRCIEFGLFVNKTPGTPAVYHFHSLFREFLLRILEESHPPEEVAGLNLRAARYYATHGPYFRVAAHLAKSGDSEAAVDLVTSIGVTVWMTGDHAQLRSWLDSLPEAVVHDSPVLLTYKAKALPHSRHADARSLCEAAVSVAGSQGDSASRFWAAAALAYLHLLANDWEGLRQAAFNAQRPAGPDKTGLGDAWVLADMMQAIARNRFLKAKELGDTIKCSSLTERSQFMYLGCCWASSCCLGRLDDATRHMESALALGDVSRVAESRIDAERCLAETLILRNEKDRLPLLVADVISTAERLGFDYYLAYGRRVAAYERYLSSDRKSALELLDYVIFHFESLDNRPMAAASSLLKMLWSTDIAPEEAKADVERVRELAAIVSKASLGMLTREISLSIAGAIACEASDYAYAERCLLSAARSAKAMNASHTLCGACFHLAKLYYSQGKSARGARYLKQAMNLAEKGGYYSFWDIHLPTLVEVAMRSIRSDMSAAFAEKMLAKIYGKGTASYLAQKAAGLPPEAIAGFAAVFAREYTPEKPKRHFLIQASLLGKPEIVVNGVKIGDDEWKTRKVKGVLEYLLLSSGNTVPRETLMDAFWPDADAKSAGSSLWTALYQVRRTLSAHNVETSGSDAFIAETLGGLRVRTDDALRLDIHEFDRLRESLSDRQCAGALTAARDAQRRLETLRKIVALYKGDLLEGNDYGDLVRFEREKYRSAFVEASLELASLYMSAEQPRSAEQALRRAMAADPLNENVCLELLRVLVSRGMKNRAVQVYRSFEKHLRQELDLAVDARLAQALREN